MIDDIKAIKLFWNSLFQFLYGGQFTLSTPLINQIFVFHSPTDAAPQFLQKLTLFTHFCIVSYAAIICVVTQPGPSPPSVPQTAPHPFRDFSQSQLQCHLQNFQILCGEIKSSNHSWCFISDPRGPYAAT